MHKSSKIQKPKILSRSDLRRNRSLKISRSSCPSDSPCDHCCRRRLKCLIMEDNRCFECVASGVEGGCNAEGCIDRLLSEKEVELKVAMERVTVLLKEISELKIKSRQEYD